MILLKARLLICKPLPPPRLPAAALAWLSARRAWAGAGAIGLRLGSRTHLVERGLARALVVGAMRRDLVIERDAHLIEAWFVDAAGARARTPPHRAPLRAATLSRRGGGERRPWRGRAAPSRSPPF